MRWNMPSITEALLLMILLILSANMVFQRIDKVIEATQVSTVIYNMVGAAIGALSFTIGISALWR